MINQLEVVGPSRLPLDAYIKAFETTFHRTLSQWMEKSLITIEEYAKVRAEEVECVNVSLAFSQVSLSSNCISVHHSNVTLLSFKGICYIIRRVLRNETSS